MLVFAIADTHLPRSARALPKERVVEAGGARIGMLHIPGPAAGREARLVARFPGCDAVVYGHTHVPQVERHDGVWILTRARRPSAGRRRGTRCSSSGSRPGRSSRSSFAFRDDCALDTNTRSCIYSNACSHES